MRVIMLATLVGFGLIGCGSGTRPAFSGSGGRAGTGAGGAGGAGSTGATSVGSLDGSSGGGPADGGALDHLIGAGGSGFPDGAVADGAVADGTGAGGIGSNACTGPTPPPATLRRLDRFEYNNTVRDLFGDTSRPANAAPVEGIENEFVQVTAVSAQTVQHYHTMAHAFAIQATKDAASVKALIQCDVLDATAGGEVACRRRFVNDVITRVFRRALNAQDAAELDEVFAIGQQLGGTFTSGVRAVVEVALQSPEFLYRIEFGQPIDARIARPKPHEMATRLSYLLWGSTPDAVLLEAATRNELQTKEQIASQARRLLADDRSRAVVRHFYFKLLGFYESSSLDGAVIPKLTAQIGGLMRKETEHFIDDVTWNAPGDFQTLLTTPTTWVNGPLAGFYGIAGIGGEAFQKVKLDATRHAGLLTQPTFLAGRSYSSGTSPVHRGLW
ncbi:MAG: DUF1592 domain-containing protein, partial [Deltaproteobacteria bacterium]|nr:DUF1592 domain-containing protein [Deltaproteobacteria bacterium]